MTQDDDLLSATTAAARSAWQATVTVEVMAEDEATARELATVKITARAGLTEAQAACVAAAVLAAAWPPIRAHLAAGRLTGEPHTAETMLSYLFSLLTTVGQDMGVDR